MNWVDTPQLKDKEKFKNPELSLVHRSLRSNYLDMEVTGREYHYKPCKCGHYDHSHEVAKSKGTILQKIICCLIIGSGFCKNCECKHYESMSYEKWLDVGKGYVPNVYYLVARSRIGLNV